MREGKPFPLFNANLHSFSHSGEPGFLGPGNPPVAIPVVSLVRKANPVIKPRFHPFPTAFAAGSSPVFVKHVCHLSF